MKHATTKLLPKQKMQGESRTEKHSHSRCKHICYATTMMPVTWQTQHFIRTTSCVADA